MCLLEGSRTHRWFYVTGIHLTRRLASTCLQMINVEEISCTCELKKLRHNYNREITLVERKGHKSLWKDYIFLRSK